MSMPRRHDAGVAAPPRGNLPSASQATPTRGRGRAKGSAVRMACAVLLASCAVRCDDLPLSGTSRLGSTTASALLSRARYPPQHIHTERAAVSAQSPHLPRGRLRGGGGDGQGGGASPVAGGSGGALSRTRSVSQVPVRLLRDVIRRVQSQDWMNVLGIAEGTASIATGRASPSLPAPPTSHLARELAPGTGEAAGAAGEGGLMLPPGLASEEQASADRLFAGALKHDPESVEVLRLYARYVHLSRCHRPPTSARLVEVGDTSRDEAAFAEKLFERALARDPTNPETLCDYGLFLFLVREDPNGAERRFKESLGLESDADFDEVQELLRPPAHWIPQVPTLPAILWRFVSRCFGCAVGRQTRAVRAPTTGRRNPPGLPEERRAANLTELLTRYGQILYERGLDFTFNPQRDDFIDFDEAEEMLQWTLVYNPRCALALHALAVLHHRVRKRFDQAELFYQRALQVNPRFADALNDYAYFLCYVRKDHAEALELWMAALKVEPGHIDATCNLGYLKAMCQGERSDHPGEEWWPDTEGEGVSNTPVEGR